MRFLTFFALCFLLNLHLSSAKWLEANCTVVINDCKVQEDGTCTWWYPFCKVQGGCEDQDIPDPACCFPDECGDSFAALVGVEFPHGNGTQKSTIYDTMRGLAVSSMKDVNIFLTQYQLGTSHTCIYDEKAPYRALLNPGKNKFKSITLKLTFALTMERLISQRKSVTAKLNMKASSAKSSNLILQIRIGRLSVFIISPLKRLNGITHPVERI